jgi:hypothetical protein
MLDAGQMEKRQRGLADFGEFALRSDNLDAALTEACRLVAEALGTERAKVLEIEGEGQTLFVRSGVRCDKGVDRRGWRDRPAATLPRCRYQRRRASSSRWVSAGASRRQGSAHR